MCAVPRLVYVHSWVPLNKAIESRSKVMIIRIAICVRLSGWVDGTDGVCRHPSRVKPWINHSLSAQQYRFMCQSVSTLSVLRKSLIT